MSAARKRALALAAVVLMGLPPAAGAFFGANELKVYSPQVSQGERELEYLGFAGPGHEQGLALAAGYGLTSFWEMEAYEVIHRDPATEDEPSPALKAGTAELESRFQLAPPGRLWADLGLLAEWSIPRKAGDPGELALAPLIEKQLGDAVLTLNAPLERQYGSAAANGTIVQCKARLQVLLHPLLSPGFEYFGEFGPMGAWPGLGSQTHAAGPALLGSLGSGLGRLRYRAAGLFGLTPAAPSWTLVTQLEFEF